MVRIAMNVRRATVADIDQMVGLRVAFLQEAADVDDSDELRSAITDYLHRALSSGDAVAWVAGDRDDIVAMGVVTIYERMMWSGVGREGYVLSMYTVPRFRKQGIGTKIVEEIATFARKERLKLALIATEDGRPIYERAGFKPDDRYLRWR